MSDIETDDTVTDQPGDNAAEVQADNQPSELEQKLTAAETRIGELTAAGDKHAKALFEARVAATGRLADPTDMAFNAALLDDADALSAAVDALLAAKPHLASRKPAWGDVGAGQTQHREAGPTFADLFR